MAVFVKSLISSCFDLFVPTLQSLARCLKLNLERKLICTAPRSTKNRILIWGRIIPYRLFTGRHASRCRTWPARPTAETQSLASVRRTRGRSSLYTPGSHLCSFSRSAARTDGEGGSFAEISSEPGLFLGYYYYNNAYTYGASRRGWEGGREEAY